MPPLSEVSFVGDAHSIRDDNGSTNFVVPQWLDNNLNGVTTDQGDRQYPIAYTRGTTPIIEAKFKINCSDCDTYTPTFKFRAIDSTNGISIPETIAILNGDTLTIGPVSASSSFPNTIDYIPILGLNWEVSVDNGEWHFSGDSQHKVYITLNDPIGLNPYETYYLLGTQNAEGHTSASSAVSSIYQDFTDRIVFRADGVQLKYWNPVETACQTVQEMLAAADGNGTCVAWSHLLHGIIETQGIFGSEVIEIESVYRNDNNFTLDGSTDRGVFLVKNWSFSANGSAPQDCSFSHLDLEVTDLIGSPAQGNVDPPGGFFNHFILRYNGKYYDPSYGTGPFQDQPSWENASIAGYRRVCDSPSQGPTIVNVPDDPSIVETVFD